MLRLVLSLVLSSVLVLPGLAAAQESESAESRLILGPNAGNLGVGPEAGLRLNDHFGLRVGSNYISLENEREGQDPEFNFNVTPPAAGAMLDYYPFEGGFRLTGGLRYNAETPDLIEGPSRAITLGGLPFTPSSSRSTGTGQDYIGYAPYGGLGLQSRFWEGRLELVFDLGVYYHATSIRSSACPPPTVSDRAQTRADRARASRHGNASISASASGNLRARRPWRHRGWRNRPTGARAGGRPDAPACNPRYRSSAPSRTA
jgi:hypothetical protein